MNSASKHCKTVIAVVLCMSLLACSVDAILDDINVVIQIAASIGGAVGNVSPADAAIVAKLSGIATAGLAVIKADYDTYKASGATTDLQKLQAAISAVRGSLQQALAAAHITDPASVTKVTNWVNLIASSLDAVLAALPSLQTTPKGSFTVGVTAKTLQARWKSEVCQNDTKCGKLVKVPHHRFQ